MDSHDARPVLAPEGCSLVVVIFHGRRFTNVAIEGSGQYFVGVHVAKFLKRETFNLYRSLKARGSDPLRGGPDLLEWLMYSKVIKRGTRSVTLIEYDAAVAVMEIELAKGKTEAISVEESRSTSEGEEEDGGFGFEEAEGTEAYAPKAWEILANMAFDTNIGFEHV